MKDALNSYFLWRFPRPAFTNFLLQTT